MTDDDRSLLAHWKARAENLTRASLHTELWSELLAQLAAPTHSPEWVCATQKKFSNALEEYGEAEDASTNELEKVAFTLLLDGIESWLDALDSLAEGAPTRIVRRLAEQGQRNLVAAQRLGDENPSLAQRLLAW